MRIAVAVAAAAMSLAAGAAPALAGPSGFASRATDVPSAVETVGCTKWRHGTRYCRGPSVLWVGPPVYPVPYVAYRRDPRIYPVYPAPRVYVVPRVVVVPRVYVYAF